MSEVMIAGRRLALPLIQGGMGIGISLSGLAGAVARRGAMGVVSGVNPGYREADFMQDPVAVNGRVLQREVAKAKDIAGGHGLIAVNIMVAMRSFDEMVGYAVKAGADALICGAGLPLNLPDLVPTDVLIAPIVSSRRALRLIVDTWQRRYQRLPDFVVCEGALAGGHLGFKMKDIPTASLEALVREVRAYLDELNDASGRTIPMFAAGGIRSAEDVRCVQALGADGVQVGTPFIATEECDAALPFKETVVAAKESDLRLINSPAGFPARAVANSFLRNKEAIFGRCIRCLKTCDPATAPYCLSMALAESAKGRSGLVFSGARVDGIRTIRKVDDVIDELMEGII